MIIIKITIITIIIIITLLVFSVIRAKGCFWHSKKRTKLPEVRGGGLLFSGEVFPCSIWERSSLCEFGAVRWAANGGPGGNWVGQEPPLMHLSWCRWRFIFLRETPQKCLWKHFQECLWEKLGLFYFGLGGRSEMAKMFSFHWPDGAKNVLMVLACWIIMCGQFAPRRPEQKACSLPAQLLQPFSHSQRSETQKLFSRIVFCLKTPFGEIEQEVWKLAVDDGAHTSHPDYLFLNFHIYLFTSWLNIWKLPSLCHRCVS